MKISVKHKKIGGGGRKFVEKDEENIDILMRKI